MEDPKIPCDGCICFAVCQGQDMNTLINKCPDLRTFMESNLSNFDIAFTILNNATNSEEL